MATSIEVAAVEAVVSRIQRLPRSSQQCLPRCRTSPSSVTVHVRHGPTCTVALRLVGYPGAKIRAMQAGGRTLPLCNIRMTCRKQIWCPGLPHVPIAYNPCTGGHSQARSSSQETGSLRGNSFLLQSAMPCRSWPIVALISSLLRHPLSSKQSVTKPFLSTLPFTRAWASKFVRTTSYRSSSSPANEHWRKKKLKLSSSSLISWLVSPTQHH